MDLTNEQKDALITAIKDSSTIPHQTIRTWIKDNGFEGQIGPGQVLQQLRNTHYDALIAQQFPKMMDRWSTNVTANVASVASCDALIAALQGAIVEVQAKKAELEGS